MEDWKTEQDLSKDCYWYENKRTSNFSLVIAVVIDTKI